MLTPLSSSCLCFPSLLFPVGSSLVKVPNLLFHLRVRFVLSLISWSFERIGLGPLHVLYANSMALVLALPNDVPIFLLMCWEEADLLLCSSRSSAFFPFNLHRRPAQRFWEEQVLRQD